MKRQVIVGLLVAAEVAAAAYVALVAYLFSVWMVGDERAFRMTDRDWLVEGGLRFGVVLLIAGAFGGVATFVHRRWVVPVGSQRNKLFAMLPAVLAAGIVIAGAIGATCFVVTRPFV